MTTMTSRSRPNTTTAPLFLVGAALVAVAVSALVVALVVAGGAYEAPPPGITDAGPIVVWGTAILRLLTDLAAIATIGWLLAAAFIDPAGKGGVVSKEGARRSQAGRYRSRFLGCPRLESDALHPG